MKTSLLTSLITAAVAIAALALTSCAGLSVTASSPWGDVTTRDGATVIAPRPIVIPVK